MGIRPANPFKDKAFMHRIIHLASPMVLQYLLLALVGVSDALMLGSLDQNAMSAVSLATQIQFIQNVIMGALTSAESVLAAQYWGKNDRRTVQEVLSLGIRVCGLVSLAFALGCILAPEALMTVFTDANILIENGARYLRIAGWSYLLTGISQPFLTVIKATGHPQKTALISGCTVVLNILLNGALIFGWLGLPAMGIEGAALATVICRVVELAWAVIVSRGKGYVAMPFGFLFTLNRVLTADFLKCMLPLLGAGLFWGVGFVSYSAFMGHMGTDAVAANSVAAVVRDLVCCMCDGMAGGSGVLIGNELGAGNLGRARDWGDRLVVLSFIIGAVSAVLMLAAVVPVTMLVHLTEAARGYLGVMMAIMALYMIGRAVNTIIINGVLAAGGDTMFDMYSLAVTMWGIAIPLAALGTFVLHWPVAAVYACTCLDEIGKIPWMLLHYRKYRWVRNLTREFSEHAQNADQ